MNVYFSLLLSKTAFNVIFFLISCIASYLLYTNRDKIPDIDQQDNSDSIFNAPCIVICLLLVVVFIQYNIY